MNYQQISPGEEEPLDSEHERKLREENEILKLKIQAQFGGMAGTGEEMPADLENQFLKNVIAFEEKYTRENKKVKLAEVLGNPDFKKAEAIDNDELAAEFSWLNELLTSKNIQVDFIRERDDSFKYKFITEELFETETDSVKLPEMTTYFTYEEFHPDHEQEMRERTMEFLGAWFERDVERMKQGLVACYIQPDGSILSQEEILSNVQAVFDSFRLMEDCKYHIFEIKFEPKESADGKFQGIGHSEGVVKYDVILETGERKNIEGPFKLYMTRDYDWWSIMYFVMAGFG